MALTVNFYPNIICDQPDRRRSIPPGRMWMPIVIGIVLLAACMGMLIIARPQPGQDSAV